MAKRRRPRYKHCLQCDRVLAFSAFGVRTYPSGKRTRRSACKDCEREAGRRYRLENPEKSLASVRKWQASNEERYKAQQLKHSRKLSVRQRSADNALRRTYGISLEVYNQRLKEQGGGCAICNKKPSNRRLHVDHDHKTGKVRGLLCYQCNTGLGVFRDDPNRTRRATEYLERYQGDIEQSLPDS